MDDREFAAGMHALGAAFNRPMGEDVLTTYRGVLGEMSGEDWQRAVRRCLESEPYFPPPAKILGYARAAGPPEAQAMASYDRILEVYERGGESKRLVMQNLTPAERLAFAAAGGDRAFAWCEPKDEPFRRKAFREAWVVAVQEDPRRALPASEQPQLSRGDARSALDAIRGRGR